MNTTIQMLNISSEDLGLLIEKAVSTAMERKEQKEYLNRFDKYPDQMTLAQVAEVLGISKNYVRDLARQGCYRRVKVSTRNSFYMKETVLKYWESLTAKKT